MSSSTGLVLVLGAVLAVGSMERNGGLFAEFTVLLFGCFTMLIGNLLLNQNKMLYVPVCQTHAELIPRSQHLSSNHPTLRKPPPRMKHVNMYFYSPHNADGSKHKIHAWLFPGTESKNKTVMVYLHGNAGNIGHRIPTWEMFRENLPAQVDLLCFDYRGFGDSEGEPTEQGLVADCIACVEHARTVLKYTKVVLFGTSLGAAVAVRAWRECPQYAVAVDACILENGFTSVCDVACAMLPLLVPFKPLLSSHVGSNVLLTNVFDTKRLLMQASCNSGAICPMLILYGEQDEIVPPHHSQELYGIIHETHEHTAIKAIPFASHNNLAEVGQQVYFDSINDFITKV